MGDLLIADRLIAAESQKFWKILDSKRANLVRAWRGWFSRVFKKQRERERKRNGNGGVSCARHLRARQGRFSVNLRVIPVISCLENHAVALMLHCLSSPPASPYIVPDYSQSTPTILTMNSGSHRVPIKNGDYSFRWMSIIPFFNRD